MERGGGEGEGTVGDGVYIGGDMGRVEGVGVGRGRDGWGEREGYRTRGEGRERLRGSVGGEDVWGGVEGGGMLRGGCEGRGRT